MRTLRHVARHQSLAAAALYVLIACWMLWPLPRYAGSAVQDPGDPLFEIWVMRSVQHNLTHQPRHLFDGTAFYPFRYSLAYSEEAISTALVAWPVYLVSANDVLAYNAVFIGSFWLMAFAVFLLARELGASPGAAFIAGIAAAFAPARYSHLSHLHLLTLCWLPLALWALAVFVRTRRRRYAALFGIALAAQLLASLHTAVFATVALALFLPFVLWSGRRQIGAVSAEQTGASPRVGFERRAWVWLGLALVVPYLLLAPTLLPHLRVGDLYGFERSRDEVRALAAHPGWYLDVFVTNHVWAGALGTRAEAFFPGAVALVGAGLAVLAWRRWPARWALLLTAVAVLFSFGLSLAVAGRDLPMPWALVYDIIPPVRGIRGVGRFGLLTAIGVPLLAAFGYTAFWQRLRPRLGERAMAVGLALTVLLTLGTMAELRSSVRADHVPADPPFVAWLAGQPGGPVVEFPADGLITPHTTTKDGLFEPIRSMYWSAHHWRPIVAGYSGFVPEPHLALIQLLGRHGDEPSAVTAWSIGVLQDLGVRWVVIHHTDGYDWQRAVALANGLPELRPAVELGEATIYELAPGARQRLSLDDVQLTMPEAIGAGLPFHISVKIENPNLNLALLRLTPSPDLRVVWRDASGDVVREQRASLALPLAAEPETSGILTPAETPTDAGLYTVEAWLDRHPATRRTQQVEIFHSDVASEPAARLVDVRWDPTTVVPGVTVAVDVTWQVLRPLGAEYASTVQILDEASQRRAGSDLLPGGYDPPSSQWQPGQTVTLRYQLAVPPDLPAGAYRLLTAIYAWQEGYPRLPIVRPDGTTGSEAILDRFVVR